MRILVYNSHAPVNDDVQYISSRIASVGVRAFGYDIHQAWCDHSDTIGVAWANPREYSPEALVSILEHYMTEHTL